MEAGGLTPSGGILGYMTGGFFDDDYDPLAPMLAGDEASREFSGIAQRLRLTAADYDEREQTNASISDQVGVAR